MYDPVDEIAFREYPDTKHAIEAVLDEAGQAKVYAVGEYHATRAVKVDKSDERRTRSSAEGDAKVVDKSDEGRTRSSAEGDAKVVDKSDEGRTRSSAEGDAKVVDKSPLARFTSDVLDLMIPRSKHLVIETWLDAGCQPSRQVNQEVQKETGRPAATSTDIEALVMKSARKKLVTHGLAMTCIEHGSLLDAMGRVDFLRLLELVTEKLGDTTRQLVEAEVQPGDARAVIVYGGAVHNDLFPRWQLETLSYTQKLNADLGGGVVEIDLVVPEIIAPMSMVRSEPWFPLIGRASPNRVMVWKRGPTSFVVILPAQSEEVAKIARPVHRG